ncbi:MAG TPA: energy-coupling factor transporter transmembrane component T [Kineosporiaceae bacterium]|nr:energy-coupling factor transporter transmembrane component T [Kineosporiaceae bacterium]
MSSQVLGGYVPGTSMVHRARPGVKLALLAAALVVLAALRSPLTVVIAVAVVLAVAGWARIGLRALAAQVRPVLAFAVIAGGLQLWSDGPVAGATVGVALIVAVAAAALVTLTTPTQDLLDAVVAAVRPFARLGIDPDRVGLTLALAIRSVPVVAQLARDVQEARMARGAGRSIRAFAVPLVIRTVRHADRLGEALAARGVDD